MNKVFTPFPSFETSRLKLRRLEQTDANDIFLMRSHPMMHQYTDTVPDTQLVQAVNYIDRIHKGIENQAFILWGIELKSEHKIIGTVCIWNFDELRNSGELGYGIYPTYHHYGYMTEALQSIIRFGFDQMNLTTIEAYTETQNHTSIKLLEKFHFIKENVIVEKGQNRNQDFHMAIYALNH